MRKHGMLSDKLLNEIVGGRGCRRSARRCQPKQESCDPAPKPDCGDNETSSCGCAAAISGALRSFTEFSLTFVGLKGGTGKQALRIIGMVLRAGQ